MNTKCSPSSPERAHALAQSLDYLTEQDLCALCQISPSTAETWRKRRKGPGYVVAGNSVLYPRQKVRDFLESRVRAW